jgi:CheY-like chemotaxis protein
MTGSDSMPRILAVDDDPAVLRWMEAVLSSAGYVVDRRGSASDAQSLLAQYAYSLVVTDLQMPGASGLDLIRGLRATNRQLPVILVSGGLDAATRLEAEALGRVECLNKPLDSGGFLGVVRRLVPSDGSGPTAGQPSTPA